MAATNRNFWDLISVLNEAGWNYMYRVTTAGRDATTTYYLAPNYADPDAISEEEMINALISVFGSSTCYIYRIDDVANIWGNRPPVLEITLPNK